MKRFTILITTTIFLCLINYQVNAGFFDNLRNVFTGEEEVAAEEVVVEQPQRPARQQAAAEEVVVEQPQRPARQQAAAEEVV
ncbi:hypothetical protein KJ708_13285, partial [bacterium]|nr:hypothetical protein [bacterium]MBU1918672.1 hypothetical protein [bacterium]